jgi:hypothetical protein
MPLWHVHRTYAMCNTQGVAAAVRAAGDLLLAYLETPPPPPHTPPTTTSSSSSADTTSAAAAAVARGPDALLRHGALGSRVAAAVAAAMSPARADERDRGLGALRVVLKEETTRQRAAEAAVVLGAGEDSGGADELLLRLALTLVRFSCQPGACGCVSVALIPLPLPFSLAHLRRDLPPRATDTRTPVFASSW